MSKEGAIIVLGFVLVSLFVILAHASIVMADDNKNLNPVISASSNATVSTSRSGENTNNSGNANSNATFASSTGASSHNNEKEVEVEDNGQVRNVAVHEGEDAEQIREALQHKNKIDISGSQLPDNCDKTGAVIKCDIGGQMQVVVDVSSENVNLSAATQQTLDSLKSSLQNNTNEVQIQIEVESGHSAQVETEGGITADQKNILDLLVNETVSDVQAAGSSAHISIKIKSKFVEERAMAVIAGNSGNVILQVKGVNATIQVQLYKSNGSVYALLADNSTVLINYFPDDVQEEILQTLNNTETEGNASINLEEDGNYTAGVDKHARFLGIFKVSEHMTFVVDPKTGNVLEQHTPWWGFLAADVKANTTGTNATGNSS